MSRAGLDSAAIIGCAASMADANGLESVTLAAVAAELKVRTPSLYNHIGGLPGLRRGLALAGVRELEQRLAHAAVGRSGDEAVRSVGFAYLDYVRSRPGLYEATVRAPDPQDSELEAASQRVIGLLQQVLQQYRLKGDDMIHVVRGLRSIAHGFATLELKGGFGMKVDLDESFAKLLNLFIDGLHASLEPESAGKRTGGRHA